jgi:Leucine-rich repeat (LRR) protein
MKHNLLYAILLFALLTPAGCTDDGLNVAGPGEKQEGRVITLTASMPEEPSATRMTLTPESGDYPKIALAWTANDPVEFCLVQGTTKVRQTAQASNISLDGKTAQFAITVPGAFTAGTFDIYGIYGGSLDSGDPTKATIAPASEPKSLADIKVALTFSQTGVSTSSPALDASFGHLGSLLCVSIENVGSQSLDLSNEEIVLEGLTTNKWAVYEAATFDITAETALFGDADKKTEVAFYSNESNVTTGNSGKLWAWKVPTGDYTGYLKLTQGQNESNNVLHGRSIPEAGKAYYINVKWDGTDYSFDGGVEFTPLTEFTISNGVLTAYNGAGGEIILPPEVTSIADGVNANNGIFMGKTSITKVYLNNVTVVGRNAFKNCEGITYVDAPNVVTVNSEGFHAVKNMEAINSPKLKSVGDHAFQDCNALTTFPLKGPVIEFNSQQGLVPGVNAFRRCNSLITVDLSNVTEIVNNVALSGHHLFSNCANLETVDLSGLTEITIDQMFHQTKKLKTINLSSIKEIKSTQLFYECAELTTVTGLENVTKITNGQQMFKNCNVMTTIDLSSLRELVGINDGKNAAPGNNLLFQNCGVLTEVKLDNLEVIEGEQMFSNCLVLTRVTMPKIKEIGANVFAGAPNTLAVVDLHDATELDVTKVAANAFPDNANLKIYVATDAIKSDLISLQSYLSDQVFVGPPAP